MNMIRDGSDGPRNTEHVTLPILRASSMHIKPGTNVFVGRQTSLTGF